MMEMMRTRKLKKMKKLREGGVEEEDEEGDDEDRKDEEEEEDDDDDVTKSKGDGDEGGRDEDCDRLGELEEEGVLWRGRCAIRRERVAQDVMAYIV